jgi:hypothetical protein
MGFSRRLLGALMGPSKYAGRINLLSGILASSTKWSITICQSAVMLRERKVSELRAASRLPKATTATIVGVKTPVFTTRYSQSKVTFLKSLADDLCGIGMPAHLGRRRNILRFRVTLENPSTAELCNLMRREKAKRLIAEATFLKKVDASQLFDHFSPANGISVKAIKPEVTFCRTRTDFDLFRLCRLLQSVPTSRLLYRQIAALIIGAGQPTRPVMGAIGLASPVYSLR